MDKNNPPGITLANWIQGLAKTQHAKEKNKTVLYYLSLLPNTPIPSLLITPWLGALSQQGKPKKAALLFENSTSLPWGLAETDISLLEKLSAYPQDTTGHGYLLPTENSEKIFQDLLLHKRMYLEIGTPLLPSETHTLPTTLSWFIQPDATQVLAIQHTQTEELIMLLPFTRPWGYGKHSGICAPLDIKFSTKSLFFLQNLSPILPESAHEAYTQITEQFPNLPAPKIWQNPQVLPASPPQVHLILSGSSSHQHMQQAELHHTLLLNILFTYGTQKITPHYSLQNIYTYQPPGTLLYRKRSPEIEHDIFQSLLENGWQQVSSADKNQNSADFSLTVSQTTGAPTLKKLKKLSVEKNWAFTVEKSCPFALNITIDAWLFDLHSASDDTKELNFTLQVQAGEKTINLLPVLSNFVQSNLLHSNDAYQKLVKDVDYTLDIGNGECISLRGAQIQKILETLCELLYPNKKQKITNLEFSVAHLPILTELEKVLDKPVTWSDPDKKQLIAKAQSLPDFPSENLPKSFKATLRPYQKEGVLWLQNLKIAGLGGILADDMGLGKTVQTLAHLSIEKNKGNLIYPTLLIAPTSVVENWAKEIQRFAPYFSTLCWTGANRRDKVSTIDNTDIVLTSYTLLLKDCAILLEKKYFYVILDEAQNIKNSRSKTSQIVYHLNTQHKLCLTGTPVENHLGELWSLFHFVMPNLLGSEKKFSTLFKKPIELEKNTARAQQLMQRIRPFFLARKKEVVLQDLPKKTSSAHSIILSSRQRELYETVRLTTHTDLRKMIQSSGIAKSQVWILSALLKLRQICCDPRLLQPDHFTAAESGKLQHFLSLLDTLYAEGRKVLVFSSFSSMLSLISKALKARHYPHMLLTGSTRHRGKVVDAFQQGSVPFFLISLKAGGVGLNLTEADTVIHYDPWWNPAAEAQATNRAHRIGQTRPVFVHKLIAKNTIEEKISAMQKRKEALLSQLIGENPTQKRHFLTEEDIENLFSPASEDT